MPKLRSPLLEAEVGALLHNKAVADLTVRIMKATPTAPDRLVLLAAIVSGVIHYTAREDPAPEHTMLEIVLTESEEQLKRLQRDRK